MSVAPAGAWGPYPAEKFGLVPYGWLQADSDGTILSGSPNLSIIKGGTGNYLVQPKDHMLRKQAYPVAGSSSGVPFLPAFAYGLGPTSDAIQVSMFNSTTGALADEPFYFILFYAPTG